MPLTAWINNKKVVAFDVSNEDWEDLKRQPSKEVSLACCKSPGYLRTSKFGTKHFVHKHKTGCDWKPESEEHRRAKEEIVKACREIGYEAETEVSGSDWRADVLATLELPEKKRKIKVAFEVQWSPQDIKTTQERQEKYKRDDVRGCWLFQKLPSSEQTKDLPMFDLRLNIDNNLFEVTINHINTSLFDFVKDLLSKQIRFCSHYVIKSRYVELIFFPVCCWKCHKSHYIYQLKEDCTISSCGKKLYWCSLDSLSPEVVNVAKNFLKTDKGKNINMGEIKSRYSHTLKERYTSFGCPRCDAIFGNHYIFSEYCEASYDDDIPKISCIAEYNIQTNTLKHAGNHWCYPQDGKFCDLDYLSPNNDP